MMGDNRKEQYHKMLVRVRHELARTNYINEKHQRNQSKKIEFFDRKITEEIATMDDTQFKLFVTYFKLYEKQNMLSPIKQSIQFFLTIKNQSIKKPPGTFLNRSAEFLFSKKAYCHIFQPMISDMREEYFEALEEGRTAKAKWINARSWCTFIITACLHGLTSALKVIGKIKKLAD